jgi:hypothetical protein
MSKSYAACEQIERRNCGGPDEITCNDKYNQLKNCKQLESERLRREAGEKREKERQQELAKKRAEVDAINKINQANQKLQPHLDRSPPRSVYTAPTGTTF